MNVKNIFKKSNLMPVIVLAAICLVVAALMGLVNMITAPIVEEAEKKAVAESLVIVMPDGLFTEQKIPDGAPETVKSLYKEDNGMGHVVILETTKGYTGQPIGLTVGVDPEGKITGVKITKTSETKTNDEMEAFPDKLVGLKPSEVLAVDLVSGVTYSSRAVKNAVNDALVVLGFASPVTEEAPDKAGASTLTDKEVIARAEALAGKKVTEKTVAGLPGTVKNLFKAGGDTVIHISVRGDWVPTASEAIVLVGSNGKVKDIDWVSWVVGHGVPVTEEFIESFNGKHADALGRVELVSGATGTSADFTNELRAVLEILYPTPTYSIIGAVVIALALIGSVTAVVLIKMKGRAKNEK